jgi:hypothetical protein
MHAEHADNTELNELSGRVISVSVAGHPHSADRAICDPV